MNAGSAMPDCERSPFLFSMCVCVCDVCVSVCVYGDGDDRLRVTRESAVTHVHAVLCRAVPGFGAK